MYKLSWQQEIRERASEWDGGGGGGEELEGIKEEMGGNEQECEADFAPCEDQPYWESAPEIFK